jgi:hypothetical protein
MKHLSLLTCTLFSIALSAQTVPPSANAAGNAGISGNSTEVATASTETATNQAGQLEEPYTATSSVSAELTKRIDTRNAKVGDEVQARTISDTRLSDGTRLPKGTKLVGQVTDVHAKSGADKTSHLAFNLSRAVLRDGREVRLHATLTSLAAPSAAAAAGMDDMSAGGGMAGGGASAGGRASGGGPIGSVGRTTGGVVNSGAGVAGAAPGGVAANGGDVLRSAADTGDGVRPVAGVGTNANATRLDHVPVANLPGVTFSSAAGANVTGSLDVTGRNITLESGTQLTLNVSGSRE